MVHWRRESTTPTFDISVKVWRSNEIFSLHSKVEIHCQHGWICTLVLCFCRSRGRILQSINANMQHLDCRYMDGGKIMLVKLWWWFDLEAKGVMNWNDEAGAWSVYSPDLRWFTYKTKNTHHLELKLKLLRSKGKQKTVRGQNLRNGCNSLFPKGWANLSGNCNDKASISNPPWMNH